MKAPMEENNQESQLQTVNLSQCGELQWTLPTNPIQFFAAELWQTLSERDTAVTYKQFFAKTFKLLAQVLALLFFLFLLVVAVIVWLWGVGFQSGRLFREWLVTKQPTEIQILSAMARLILWPIEKAIAWATDFVKNYLGWEIDFAKCQSLFSSSSTSQTPPAANTESTVTDASPPSPQK
jgi:hypothetical protein